MGKRCRGGEEGLDAAFVCTDSVLSRSFWVGHLKEAGCAGVGILFLCPSSLLGLTLKGVEILSLSIDRGTSFSSTADCGCGQFFGHKMWRAQMLVTKSDTQILITKDGTQDYGPRAILPAGHATGVLDEWHKVVVVMCLQHLIFSPITCLIPKALDLSSHLVLWNSGDMATAQVRRALDGLNGGQDGVMRIQNPTPMAIPREQEPNG